MRRIPFFAIAILVLQAGTPLIAEERPAPESADSSSPFDTATDSKADSATDLALDPDEAKTTSAGGQSAQAASTDGPGEVQPLIDPARFLTGDWNGARSELAEKGLKFELQWAQSFQSVVAGGLDTGSKYGGTLDYRLNLDLDRMGLLPGAFLNVLAESRYGESANSTAGTLLPVDTDMFFPLTDQINDNVPVTVTELAFNQFLSPQFGLILGKFQTLDGDPNEFASGRGVSQFMNLTAISPNLVGSTIPYSTLGAGIVVLPNDRITITSLVMNTTDSSTTTGFDDIGEGTTWLTEGQFQYRLGKYPGGQNIAFVYAFDNEFLNFKTSSFSPIGGLRLNTESESWAAYWSCWQYVYLLEDAPALIVPGDGRPDARGLGLFARVNFADADSNPYDWTVSAGVGGRGLIPTRDEDQLGIAFGASHETAGLAEDAQGIEAYYSLSICPGVSLTADVQVIDTASPDTDTTTLWGLRLNVRF